MSIGSLFERLARDAQDAADLAHYRGCMLAALARLIGADTGSFMDPPGARIASSRAESRLGTLHMQSDLHGVFFANRVRYVRSVERLVRAMDLGGVVIDSDVYESVERERIDLYTEILLPQGARSLLCAMVRHRGRTLGQVVLKRHGRGSTFRARDAEALLRVLPAVGLADSGFQNVAASRWADEPVLCEGTRPLGARETEVALLVCKGMRNGEIAMLFGTSRETVKKQVRSLFAKLGVSNRAELAGFLAGQRPS